MVNVSKVAVKQLRRYIPYALLLALCGCSSPPTPNTQHPTPTAPPDPWIITNLDPSTQTPALLWNGLVGLRMGTNGLGNGPMFMIDEFDTSGEEKIRALPNVLDGSWKAWQGKSEYALDPRGSSDYRQTLDMRTGTLSAKWSQESGGAKLTVVCETSLDRSSRFLYQRWTIEADTYVDLAFEAKPPNGGRSTVSNASKHRLEWAWPPSRTAIYEANELSQDIRRSDPQADMNMPWSGDEGLRISAAADKGKPFTFQRLIWMEGSPNQKEIAKALGPSKSSQGEFPDIPLKEWAFSEQGYSGKDAQPAIQQGWKDATNTDIEIDGPVEDQQFIRSALFYLRSSIAPNGGMSVSPMALSSDIYNGHVFWDADIWVFPALALLDPTRAEEIPNYRLRRSHEFPGGFIEKSGYADNMNRWMAEGRPLGKGTLGKSNEPLLWPEAAVKVAWESSVSGRETVPGPSRFQDHITGSVWFLLQQAQSLGLAEASHVSYFTRGAADFYRQRISKRSDGKYDLKETMSPDEHHIGDNDLYTNLLAQQVLDDGLWKMPRDQIPQLHLPKDDQTFLTYDNDGLRGYKQAAAVLSIYPLQYPPAEQQAKQMMERFSDKVTQNGPAMTDSIHALIWARLGEKEKAYQTWHDSWKPFVKPPLLLFSEKRNSSRTYFTTGAAGSLQTVLFGFAGLRIDSKKAPKAQWSMPLQHGKFLSIAPNLPKEWKKLTLKNLTILGKKYTFEIEGDQVRVSK